MKEFLFASTNLGKLKEVENFISGSLKVISPADPRFVGTAIPRIVEDADSYYEHALRKAIGFHRVYKMPVLSDDSGLEIDVLGGLPGVNSAYFGGEGIKWPARWAKVWEALKPFPESRWGARFRCILCYYDGRSVPVYFSGVVEGSIMAKASGTGGFGFDPIFQSIELGKSFGDVTADEKAQVSHRARALKAFLAWSKLDHSNR